MMKMMVFWLEVMIISPLLLGTFGCLEYPVWSGLLKLRKFCLLPLCRHRRRRLSEPILTTRSAICKVNHKAGCTCALLPLTADKNLGIMEHQKIVKLRLARHHLSLEKLLLRCCRTAPRYRIFSISSFRPIRFVISFSLVMNRRQNELSTKSFDNCLSTMF